MTTDDLVVWLRAQLDDEEAAAEQLRQQAREVRQELKEPRLLGKPMPGWGLWPDVERMAAGVLADVAAKRVVLDAYEHARIVYRDHYRLGVGTARECAKVDALGEVVRLLAGPYAGRPGYREEWRSC